MRTLITLLIAASLLIFSFVSFAAVQKNSQDKLSENVQSDIRQLKHDVKTTASDVEILRRDQINYRVEKDILKEAYSSNLQSINIVITIISGVFLILVYLGLRSIKEIKSEYTDELNDLRGLKEKLDAEFLQLTNNQDEFERKVVNLAKTNEEQDNRLKVMELIEKIHGIMRSGGWLWALQYINIGLDMSPDNTALLAQKSICYTKLGEFPLAIDACKKAIKLEPENIPMISNLLELLVLSNRKDEFKETYAEHKHTVDQRYGSNLIDFLNALSCLIDNDLEEAIKRLSVFVKKFPSETKKYFGESWSFDDVSIVASKLPAGKRKDLLEKTIQFFGGVMSSNDFEAYLATLGS